jgi:hypothetical protein
MNYIYALVFIFGLIGLFVVISWLSGMYSEEVKKDAKNAAESWPPPKYMDVVGSKCPDYWQFVGTKEYIRPNSTPIVYNICKNTFNIPAGTDKNNPNYCYANGSGDLALNTMTFNTNDLKWPITDKNFSKTPTCEWIRKCGPLPDNNAAWLGYSDKC